MLWFTLKYILISVLMLITRVVSVISVIRLHTFFVICDFVSVYFLGLLVVEIGGVEVEFVLFLYLCFL